MEKMGEWVWLLLTFCASNLHEHTRQHMLNETSGLRITLQEMHSSRLQVERCPYCLISTVHFMPNVSPGYHAPQLNGSRVSLAGYLESLRSYSNTQLLWCKQRRLVTRYYRYGVYKNATLMQCMLCTMIKNNV